MITLGIHDGHNASACLMKDGKILACISEERLKREKNWCGFPEEAIQACLDVAKVRAAEVDAVGVAGVIPPIRSVDDVVKPSGFRYIMVFLPKSILSSNRFTKIAVYLLSKIRGRKRIQNKLRNLGIKQTPKFYDHHSMHVLSAYGCSPFFRKNEDVLVLSCDGSGDAVCATVNIGHAGKLKRLHTVNHYHSLGELYARVTLYLGMKPLSDEYKVMGLAAYANEKYAHAAYEKIKHLISVDKTGFGLQSNRSFIGADYLKILHRMFKSERFDCIAYAIQKLTDKVLTEWVVSVIRKTGIRKVVLSGGVFMNIKSNNVILNHPEVEQIWVLPSCSDDSLSIGVAMQLSMDAGLNDIQPLRDLYLGPQYTDREIEHAISQYSAHISVQKMDDIEVHIGQQIAQGKIIGRFAGRMEWGSRALGNRSVLADPRDLRTVSQINRAVKKREFWMPFCPSMLLERADDYFRKTKDYDAYYMVMAFPSTKEAQQKIPACMHTFDYTVRPQIVSQSWNPSYHKIIKSFEKETGVGVVLNTSFNLSGYPIVCSPQDAFEVFIGSDMDALALENFYIIKK